jgi:rhomboid family GlyGly-CTERM serine protease
MRRPWISAALAAAGLAVAWIPGGAEALQYDRIRVEDGALWLLLTGQLAHWTARMALLDLGMLAGLGAWLEARGERRELVAAFLLGAAGTAVAVHALSPDLLVYRGSSGLASALFVLVALRLARTSGGAARVCALLALALFLLKAVWESATGQALFAGPLAPGVRVVPLVHLLGGVAGGVVKSFWALEHLLLKALNNPMGGDPEKR